MSESRKNPPSAVYEVGYGRPPEGAQFKPGCSGNPKGRPRKRKTVSTLIEEALARRLRVEENGRSHRISAEEIIIRRLVNAAAKGELKAVQLLLQLRDRYRDSSAESIDPQDLESDRGDSRRLCVQTCVWPTSVGFRNQRALIRKRGTPKHRRREIMLIPMETRHEPT